MNKAIVEKPNRIPAQLSELLPPEILELLGPPALVGSKSPELFYAMMGRFVVEFDPGTITEWLLVSDLVNVNWEIARYRRLKATYVRLEMPDVANRLMRDPPSFGQPLIFGHEHFGPNNPKPKLSRRRTPTESLLESKGLSISDVADATMAKLHLSIGQMEGLIERLEIRRERLLRELRTHKTFAVSSAVENANSYVEEAIVK